MFTKILTRIVPPSLLLLGDSTGNSAVPSTIKTPEGSAGTLEKLVVVSGSIAMNLDLNGLNGSAARESKRQTLHFGVAPNAFFTILVFNKELRGPEMGMMGLVPVNSAVLPPELHASIGQLAIEKVSSEEPYELVVRDAKTGFRFFNIYGHSYDYNADTRLLSVREGRLLLAEDFAKQLGRPADARSVVGNITMTTIMQPIEVTTMAHDRVQSAVMPAPGQPSVGTVPGPDVTVGDLPSVAQAGSSGSFVGLAVGTVSCNPGVVDVNWYALPANDHPVVAQNLYRMSGGATNTDRFEQIGQSWLKHTFFVVAEELCGLGCNGVGGDHFGSGCSDTYSTGLNATQIRLGSRAWVNPFTGFYPAGGSDPAFTSANHTGHTHTGTSHRVLVATSDLSTTQNVGATYFAEGQYVVPHEYAWCQSHPGECNMYNNVSYRQLSVTGTTFFLFDPVGPTVPTLPAINAWTGASINAFEPAPGLDGIGMVGYKVTNPAAGVWHYEYAVYNENIDRAIQSFSVPLGCGITVSNLGFHAPPNHPGFANDGTQGDAGFSNAAWASNQTVGALTWNSETFAQNQNANAIRWGTLYNFRFDSDKPPQAANATVGFFKTGAPMIVAIQAPTPDACNPLTLGSAVSRKTHGGAGDFDVNLPLTGEPGVECRSSSGNHTFVFSASNNLVSGNASVTTGVGTVSGSPNFAGNTMTVNLAGVTDVQMITVTLSDVTDEFAQVLPATPVSMNMLIGDTTGDKSVSASDIGQTKGQSGAAVTGANFRTDINASGTVNASDIAQVKANAGHTLP